MPPPDLGGPPRPGRCLSTKGDLYRATAITRARMGRIWHYAPDGGPTLPGATQLRWSPITESANWDTARIIGRAMTYDAGEGTTEANYFRNSAGGLASAMLHSAALGNKSMTWLLAGLGGSSRTLRQAAEICYEHQARSAGDILTNFVERDSRTTSSIFATADTAFDAFKGDGAVRTTEDPNFDELAFVRGLPDTYNPARLISYPDSSPEARLEEMYGDQHARGWFDTIYITAGSENQTVVAPLIVGLLARIRSACFRAHGQDDLSERGARRPPPLLWALDELAQLAPMSDLPGTCRRGLVRTC